MEILIQSVVFQSHLKNLFKKGKLPSVKRGLYGEKITKENVSDEHVRCKCHGGDNSQGNIALASKELNNARGCNPIENYLNYEMLQNYCFQFKGVKCQGFDGDSYVRKLKKTIEDLTNE